VVQSLCPINGSAVSFLSGLGGYSALGLCDYLLYKSTIDIDIDIDNRLVCFEHTSLYTTTLLAQPLLTVSILF